VAGSVYELTQANPHADQQNAKFSSPATDDANDTGNNKNYFVGNHYIANSTAPGTEDGEAIAYNFAVNDESMGGEVFSFMNTFTQVSYYWRAHNKLIDLTDSLGWWARCDHLNDHNPDGENNNHIIRTGGTEHSDDTDMTIDIQIGSYDTTTTNNPFHHAGTPYATAALYQAAVVADYTGATNTLNDTASVDLAGTSWAGGETLPAFCTHADCLNDCTEALAVPQPDGFVLPDWVLGQEVRGWVFNASRDGNIGGR
jgi:hypothetical protein